jgi:hypothetical protein
MVADPGRCPMMFAALFFSIFTALGIVVTYAELRAIVGAQPGHPESVDKIIEELHHIKGLLSREIEGARWQTSVLDQTVAGQITVQRDRAKWLAAQIDKILATIESLKKSA